MKQVLAALGRVQQELKDQRKAIDSLTDENRLLKIQLQKRHGPEETTVPGPSETVRSQHQQQQQRQTRKRQQQQQQQKHQQQSKVHQIPMDAQHQI